MGLLAILSQLQEQGTPTAQGFTPQSMPGSEPMMPMGEIQGGGGYAAEPMDPLKARQQETRDAYANHLKGDKKPEEFKRDNMAWRTEDLIKAIILAGLGAATGGGKGVEAGLQGLLAGKVGKTAQDNQDKYRSVQEKNQTAEQKQAREAELLKFELQNATQDYKDQQTQQKLEQQQQVLNAKEKEQRAYQIRQQWNAANDEGEVGLIAEESKRLGFPIPDEVVQKKIGDIQLNKSKAASVEWERALSSFERQRGFVDDKDALMLDAARQEIAGAYGIKPDRLRAPVSGMTLRAKAYQEQKRQFEEKIKFSRDKQDDQVAKWTADIAARSEQLRIMAERSAQGAFSADTSRMRYEMDLANKNDASKLNAAIDKKLVEVEAKIRNLRGKQNSSNTSVAARRRYESEIQGLRDEYKFRASKKIAAQEPGEPPPSDPSKITQESGFSSTSRSGVKFSFKP